jgi:hypothetical protein
MPAAALAYGLFRMYSEITYFCVRPIKLICISVQTVYCCRGSAVYGILCLMGVATLLPWNVFITENEFFNIRVHQPPTYITIADSFETAVVLVFQSV